MNKKYRVKLSQSQRDLLIDLSKKGVKSARKILRAKILLYADESELGNCMTDIEIAELLEVATSTVVRIRKRFCESGINNALIEKKRIGRPKKLRGDEEAKIIALATTETPGGRNKWTHRLLESKQVELKLSSKVSYRTIGRILKKTN
jgi:transposase